PCLVYGPVSKGIHGYNEAVSIKSIENITNTIALFTAMWCGLEQIDS
ncbi:MAG: acetylornithine deacetylase, partial [Gammaproteobacteria bacterium]